MVLATTNTMEEESGGTQNTSANDSLGSRQMLGDALRYLRLQLLAQVTKPTRKTEYKKTALHHNYYMAAFHGLLHLIPVTACMALIVLNYKNFYVGAGSNQDSTPYQFASKLLEILIQASITAIVLAFVRDRMLKDSSFPLGGLVFPYRVTDPSLLWSLELWGAFTSRRVAKRSRIAMYLLIPAAVILAALVGPSSAVLMIPRSVSHLTYTALYLLAPADDLFPTNITMNSNQLVNAYDFNSSLTHLIRNFDSENQCILTGDFGPRILWFEVYGTEAEYTAVATVPSILSADLLRYGSYCDMAVLRAAQPYVYLGCNSSTFNHGDLLVNSDRNISFGSSKQYLDNLVPVRWLAPYYNTSNIDDSFAVLPTTQSQTEAYDGSISAINRSTTAILGRPPPSSSNTSLLLVWANIDTRTDDTDAVEQYTACTVHASWAVVQTNKTQQKQFVQGPTSENYSDPDTFFQSLEDRKNIVLSPRWAQWALSLNGNGFVDDGMFKLAAPVMALGLSYVPELIRGAASFFAPRMKQYSQLDDNDLDNEKYQAINQFIEANHLYDRYDAVSVSNNSGNWTDPATLSQISSEFYFDGYGYGTSTTSVRLSLVVITFYLSMALTYLMYSVIVGVTASSWDSISELMALALNSERPSSMRNTSVGINTLGTYRQLVNVRVNTDQSLEIVFDGDNKDGKYTSVQKNETY